MELTDSLYAEIMSKLIEEMDYTYGSHSTVSGVVLLRKLTKIKLDGKTKGRVWLSPSARIARTIRKVFPPGHAIYQFILISNRERLEL